MFKVRSRSKVTGFEECYSHLYSKPIINRWRQELNSILKYSVSLETVKEVKGDIVW